MAYFGENSIHAWVNWNGTNNSIRDSYQVSSLTDNGTGDFTVNFSTNLDGYVPLVMTITRSNQTTGSTPPGVRSPSNHNDPATSIGSGGCRIMHRPTTSATDANVYGVVIVGDT